MLFHLDHQLKKYSFELNKAFIAEGFGSKLCGELPGGTITFIVIYLLQFFQQNIFEVKL